MDIAQIFYRFILLFFIVFFLFGHVILVACGILVP